MMKRLLTYGLLLLTILASHFVVSACQDDLPETTEVMLTFTTRAFVNAEETGDDSDAIDEEKMKDLRVIMLDGDNDVVGNALKQNIGTNSVMFKFQTPVTIGEEFKFLAIANENSLGLQDLLNAIQTTLSDYEDSWKNRVVTNSISPTAETPLPQTKFWTWTYGVDEEDSDKLNPTLDYIASKISVEFKNETNKAQTLKNIKLTGFGSATQGYLFMQDNDFTGQQGVQDITLVGDEGLTIPFEQNKLVKYYTYPVSIVSSPKLVATWNNVTKDLDLSKVTSLPRNQHLKILVTLTDVGIEVTYEIAGWKENTTTIGGVNPTIGDSYVVGGWETNDEEDVVIGEEPVKPDPGTGGKWSLDVSITPEYNSEPVGQSLENSVLFDKLIEGYKLGVLVNISNANDGKALYIRSLKADINYNSSDISSAPGDLYPSISDGCVDFELTADDCTLIKSKGGIEFWGNGVTITQIYIKAPEAQ